jgi:hypothetical protein
MVFLHSECIHAPCQMRRTQGEDIPLYMNKKTVIIASAWNLARMMHDRFCCERLSVNAHMQTVRSAAQSVNMLSMITIR